MIDVHDSSTTPMTWTRRFSDPGPFCACNGGSGSWEAGSVRTGQAGFDMYDKGAFGVDTPNFHRRLNAGELLPFTHWKQWDITGKCDSHDDYYHLFCHPNSSYYNHESTGEGVFWAPSPITLEGLEDKRRDYATDPYIAAAAAKIYSGSFDASTFAAELGQVAKMFKGFLRRWITELRRGNLDRLWLEGRYGWRTLYYDILDIQKAIQRLDDDRARFVERVGTDFEESTTDQINDQSSYLAGADLVDVTVTNRITIGARGMVAADVNIPSARVNLLTTAWEVTTLSFVIDWVIGVGTWLESMSLLSASWNTVASGGHHITWYREWNGIVTDNPENAGCKARVIRGSVSGHSMGTLTVRRPATVPSFPQINVNLDFLKVMDLVGIFRALVRGLTLPGRM